MKTITKNVLVVGVNNLSLKKDTQLLSVGGTVGNLALWSLQESNEPASLIYEVSVIQDGDQLENAQNYTFLGTMLNQYHAFVKVIA